VYLIKRNVFFSRDFTPFLGAFETLRKATSSFFISRCPSSTGQILMKFDIQVFFKDLS